MQQFIDVRPALPSSFTQTIQGLGDVTLAHLETWITSLAKGGDGWGDVKPCLFVRVTTSEGLVGWGEAFVLPCREKAINVSVLRNLSNHYHSTCLTLAEVVS